METRPSEIIERLWRRRPTLAAVVGATVAYLLLAGLGIVWALVGIAAACAWAAFWPETACSTTEQQLNGGGAGAGTGADSGVIVGDLPFALLDGLPDAALLLDARGHVISGNSTAQTFAPVITGRPLSHWNRSPDLAATVDSAISTGAQQRCHVRLFTPVERSLDVRATPTTGAGGASSRIVLITLRDLTEQESLTRMRADFVANASHELRTPLASLRGFVETLQGAAKNDPVAQARFLGIMQAQAERMSRLIEDLLSLSRIEMREHVAPTSSIDLAAIAKEAVATLKPQAEKAIIALATDIASGACEVIGDRDELAQVAQNLVQNAIKYGRTGGKVEVSLRREEQRVVLEVSDDGIGIATEHLPRLTERFYRVSAKDSKDRGGTGLGLAIVKHIVNRHRGEFRIVSTPGKGSTFSVVLPASPKLV